MSVLIKNMEMPTSCTYCPMLEGDGDDGLCHAASRWLDDEEYWLWYQYSEGDIDTSKPSNCPLVSVPEHGRLIDADNIGLTNFELILCQKGNPFKNALEMLLEKIENAPTIMEEER